VRRIIGLLQSAPRETEDAHLQSPGYSHDSALDKDSANIIRTWLEEVLAKTGMRPTPLAKAAGLAPSTLLRALDPEHPGSLERRSIDKIVQTFHVPAPMFYREMTPAQGLKEPEVLAVQDEDIDLIAADGQAIWLVRTRAIEMAGYLPGDRIRVDSRVSPTVRDVVVAQVVGHGLDPAETVIRIYDPPYLLTETSDPSARRKPLLVDNDRVAISGTVIKMIRFRR
jgi:hypothetical protein